MPTLNSLLCAVLAVTLSSTAALSLADPGNGKGKGHDKGGQHGKQDPASANHRHGGPSIDVAGVRIILGDNRDYWSTGAALPPGIQKNLARGKPLPPGIAKKLDSRLLGRLPHYEGYEWQQAGKDLLLITLATGVIYEVLHNVLD